MLRTLECEAAVFGCAAVEAHPIAKGGEPDPSNLLPTPGAGHLFSAIPSERWGMLALTDADLARRHLAAAELATPSVIVQASSDRTKDYLAAVEMLGADPLFCLAVEDSAEGIDAALVAGLKVIGVVSSGVAEELAGADMVIPSLHSLHVVGLHPVLVLEVDALPKLGTFHPGSHKRR